MASIGHARARVSDSADAGVWMFRRLLPAVHAQACWPRRPGWAQRFWKASPVAIRTRIGTANSVASTAAPKPPISVKISRRAVVACVTWGFPCLRSGHLSARTTP